MNEVTPIHGREECRARRQRRGIPEPARVRPQGAGQPAPERMGLHRRRRRDRNHDAPQPHGARRDRVPAAGAAQCRQGRRSVELFGRKLRLPVMLAPVGALETFDPGAPPASRAPRHVRRRPYDQFGDPTGHGECGQGRARRDAHLPALCSRRRRLCRGSRQPRDRSRKYRVLPHRRHRALQPARTRYRQALRPRQPRPLHRRRLPEGAGMAHRQADQGQVQDTADHQGHRHRRRRYHRTRSRRRMDLRLQSWRTPARPRARLDACAAGDRQGRRRARQNHGRRLVLPRRRYRQGDRIGRGSSSASAACNAGRSPPRAKPACCGCWSCWRTRWSGRWACSASRLSPNSTNPICMRPRRPTAPRLQRLSRCWTSSLIGIDGLRLPALPSWPGIAVRRTASLRSPMSRPSTSSLLRPQNVDARDKPGHDDG